MKKGILAGVVPSFLAGLASLASANPAPKHEAPAAPAAPPTSTTAAAPAAELTVEGTIKKLVAKKKEIYVTPNGGAKKMEFYFPDTAQFFKGGQSVGFDALKDGQKVKVTYTKTGKRLNPSKAEIIE